MYFITTIRIKNNEVQTQRCVGYVDTYEKAEQIIINNEYDINETIYQYAIIENIPMGLYQYDEHPQWFKWNDLLEIYEKCESPKFLKNWIGFGIG